MRTSLVLLAEMRDRGLGTVKASGDRGHAKMFRIPQENNLLVLFGREAPAPAAEVLTDDPACGGAGSTESSPQRRYAAFFSLVQIEQFHFFFGLCHALQEDKNELTATDAYWLGLVDEVMGEGGLATIRWFEEWQPDPEPASAPQPGPQTKLPAEKNEAHAVEPEKKTNAAKA